MISGKLGDLVVALVDNSVVGVDTETTDLSPLVGELRLIQMAVGDGVWVFDVRNLEEDELDVLVRILTSPQWLKIFHNAKFDCKFLKHQLGIEVENIFDTLLASVMIAAGNRQERHGLDDCAMKWCGIKLDKGLQKSDWGADELSLEQVAYAAEDVRALLPLHQVLAAQLKRLGLERVAGIEFAAIMPVVTMELAGFRLNQDKWQALLDTKEVTRLALQQVVTEAMQSGIDWLTDNPARYKRPVKPKVKKRDPAYHDAFAEYWMAMDAWASVPRQVGGLINLGSHVQIKAALTNLTGLDWAKLTTKDHVLELNKDRHPVIPQLQAYRSADKLVTSYGTNWLEACGPDSRLRCDFRLIGAETGRMSCAKPVNLQNPPADAAHRGCFDVVEGRRLIIADFSQIELRIAAHLSQDPRMMEAFNSGQDLHKYTAHLVFEVPIGDVTKAQRDLAKRLNFGVVYGIGPRKFSSLAGVSLREAELIIASYFATYGRLNEWLRFLEHQAQTRLYTRTASGRLVQFFVPEEYESEHQWHKWMGAVGRNGKNSPIQGTSADITKRSLRLVYDELQGTSGVIVNCVHDEVNVECDMEEAEALRVKIEGAMVQAGTEFITRVPVVVETVVNTCWVK